MWNKLGKATIFYPIDHYICDAGELYPLLPMTLILSSDSIGQLNRIMNRQTTNIHCKYFNTRPLCRAGFTQVSCKRIGLMTNPIGQHPLPLTLFEGGRIILLRNRWSDTDYMDDELTC